MIDFPHMVGAVVIALVVVDAGRVAIRAGAAVLRVSWARRVYARTKICPFCAKRGRAPYAGKTCGICGARNEEEAARSLWMREQEDLNITAAIEQEITRTPPS